MRRKAGMTRGAGIVESLVIMCIVRMVVLQQPRTLGAWRQLAKRESCDQSAAERDPASTRGRVLYMDPLRESPGACSDHARNSQGFRRACGAFGRQSVKHRHKYRQLACGHIHAVLRVVGCGQGGHAHPNAARVTAKLRADRISGGTRKSRRHVHWGRTYEVNIDDGHLRLLVFH
jgi:hypothetical protein